MYPSIILYLTNFLRTLFIIVVVYFVIKYVVRWLFPFIFQQGMKNMQQKMEEQLRDQQRKYRREGDVTIENNTKNKSGIHRDEGEYVDFEEVD